MGSGFFSLFSQLQPTHALASEIDQLDSRTADNQPSNGIKPDTSPLAGLGKFENASFSPRIS